MIYYGYSTSRATSEAAALIGEFCGYLHTDGFEACDRLVRERDDVIHVGCWVHVRRKFFDAKASSKRSGAADQAIVMISRLYQAERDLAGPVKRQDLTDTFASFLGNSFVIS